MALSNTILGLGAIGPFAKFIPIIGPSLEGIIEIAQVSSVSFFYYNNR